jgi:hypothetical protein
VRNSNHPDAGTLTFTTSAMRAFVDACKPGQLDHLCERRLIAIPSTAK